MNNTASVSFMITKRQALRLKGLGYTQALIDAMPPSEAHTILADFDAPGAPTAAPGLRTLKQLKEQRQAERAAAATATVDTGLEFDMADVDPLDPDPTPQHRADAPNARKTQSSVNVRNVLTVDADTQQFINILHRGGAHRFTQDLTAGPKGDKTVTRWSSVDEPLRVPPLTGRESLYYSVNPVTVRVTDADREKYKGKPDSYIEQYVASKNSTVAALNCLYCDIDGKDFTSPTADQIDALLPDVRAADLARVERENAAHPGKALKPVGEKALHNQAVGKAKSAIYKTNPEHYKALAIAHVRNLNPQPSAVVDSGGGYQCFWLFAEPFMLRTDADRTRAIQLQRRWVDLVGGDPGVNDIRRVLRLPGSINHKAAYAPKFPLVTFVKNTFDLRYSFDELAALVPPEPVQVAPANKTRTTSQPRAQRPARPDHQPRHNTDAALDVVELPGKNDSLLSLFNATFKIRDFLSQYGYTDHGDRMSRPGEPESSGVEFDEATNRSRHWSSNDQLYDPHWQTPFSIWCKLEFDNDFAAARSALIDAIFPAFHLWARTTSFEEHVTITAENGIYYTDATDTKVFDSLLDIYEKVGGLGATVSKRIGGRNAGVSPNTFVSSLHRMATFLEVTVNEDHTYYVRLKWENPVCSVLTTYALLKEVRAKLSGQNAANDALTPVINEYSPRKNAEPFMIGTSKAMRERFKLIAQALGITVKQAKEQDDLTFPGLDEACLRVIDALLRAGDMTVKELAEETGKKTSSIRTAVRKLVQHGILEATRTSVLESYTYSLCDNVWQRIDEIAPTLRNYKSASRREDKRLEAAQQWAQKGIAEAQAAHDVEQAQRCERRFAKLAKQRVPHLARLHEQLPKSEIIRLAYEVADYKRSPATKQAVRDYNAVKTADHRAEVRMISDLAAAAISEFVANGLRKPTVHMVVEAVMRFDGFNRDTVLHVISTPSLVEFPKIERTWAGVA